MPITENDIKLLQSARMTDTPNGGGRMTGNVVQSGADNNIFDDVSNLDRVYGNVSLRKVFPAVLTTTTDKYLGARVIIDEPPEDDYIDGTLFGASSLFDTRDAAKARLEAYLAPGAPYQGLLYGPHISGMMSVLLMQAVDREIPGIGETLLLRSVSPSDVVTEQYVRVTSVVGELFTFTDQAGEYKKRIVTCTIGDALRYDFTGWEATRLDSDLNYTGKSRVYSTLVANAAQYYGIQPLATPANLGSYGIKAASAFSSLVPSAQTETALVDLNGTGTNVGYAGTGTSVSYIVYGTFTTAVSLAIGASVAPGSLTLVLPSPGATVTDSGYGTLLVGGIDIGSIDYTSGICTLSNPAYAEGGNNITITYEMGAPVVLSLQSDYIPVTLEGRSMTYVASLSTAPSPGTLRVNYLANGKWYVIRDRGDSIIKGDVDGLGAGNVNYTTRSVSMTLGALPDVGSHIIFQWGRQESFVNMTPEGSITNESFLVAQTGLYADTSTINVNVSWNDGASKSFGWTEGGVPTGSGGEFVPYGSQVGIKFDVLPPKSTVVTATGNRRVLVPKTYAAGSSSSITLPELPVRGSIRLPITLVQRFTIADWNGFETVLQPHFGHNGVVFSNNNQTVDVTYQVWLKDDGNGVMVYASTSLSLLYNADLMAFGSADYATGVITIPTAAITHQSTWAGPAIHGWKAIGEALGTEWFSFQGTKSATTTIAAQALTAYYSTGTSQAFSYSGALDALTVAVKGTPAGYNIVNLSFKVGTDVYKRDLANAALLLRNPSPTTGAGTAAGTISASMATVTSWTALAANAITEFSAVASKTTASSADIFVTDRMVFRTANAPLRPGSFTVQGRMVPYADGTPITFSVTADANGIINTASLVGYVDFQTGICHLFGKASGAEATNIPQIPLPAWLGGVAGSGGYPGSWSPGLLVPASVSYSAVSYTYLPLDASILGLDPVRLPSDGRVPIFKSGRVVVVHNTVKMAPATVTNAQTVNCGRTLLARISVFGNDGLEITSGFTKNLDAGTITFTNIAGYSQPVVVEHRIEDEALCADAQITGDLRLSRPLTHAYPATTSYVSSAYIAGTLQAAAQDAFAQTTWTDVWSDSRIGTPILAQYNDTANPLVVTNAGAITERWALIFTSNTTFNVVGEEVGQIITGDTATTLAPVNPATGVPYFTLAPAGWGSGWVAGNVLRFNTAGANFPLWVARTVRQSPSAPPGTDQMTISIRGDIDQ